MAGGDSLTLRQHMFQSPESMTITP